MNNFTILVFVFFIPALLCSEEDRKRKLFSIFSIVSFKNTICNGTFAKKPDNPNCAPQGICFSKGECDGKGGTDLGDCAQGFGVCCQVTGVTSTGETISAFTNPDYPLSTKGSKNYEYEISVDNEDICQIRLDICELKMVAPTTSTGTDPSQNGKCENEYLEITGSDKLFQDPTLGITPLCGSAKYNKNQHIYIGDFSTTGETVATIKAKTSGSGSKWFVKTTLIDCTERTGFLGNLKAPRGCRQFYTEDTGEINSFNFQGDGTTKYWYPQNYKICIKRDEISDCQVRIYRNPNLSAYTVSIGLSAPLADDNEITAPYGGCEYMVTAGTDASYFWGCGIPGENSGLTSDATSTTRYTTDTGCGNQLVDLGGCFDPLPPDPLTGCRKNSIAIADYLNIPEGRFVRGSILANAVSDTSAMWVTNDYYCGAGIGGDTPGCGMGVPTPDTACADILPAVVVPIDGKSGTPSVAGLTEENSGVYQQLDGSSQSYFNMVFSAFDTSDADGSAQGRKHRLGFGLQYEKSSVCTSIQNEVVRPPFEVRRRLTTPTLAETTPVSDTTNIDVDITSTTAQYRLDENEEQVTSNEQLTEEKIYTTLLRILQGNIALSPPSNNDSPRLRNPWMNPPSYN